MQRASSCRNGRQCKNEYASCLKQQHNLHEESTQERSRQHEPDKKGGDFSIVLQEDIEEQHRNYFKEALSAAKKGSTILEELNAPYQYKGDAAIAFVYLRLLMLQTLRGMKQQV